MRAKREKLPPEAREMLTERMDRHADRTVLLFESVLVLNYSLAEALAKELVNEPGLGRPASGDLRSLNALLPPAFFTYQDQLHERAEALAVAAHAEQPEALTTAFARVAETCVACHAVYLYDEDDDPASAESHAWIYDDDPDSIVEPGGEPTPGSGGHEL